MHFLRWVRRTSKSREKRASKSSKCSDNNNVVEGEIQWEVRPGGMLVQKRQPPEDLASGCMIQIRVSHGLCHYDLTVPAQSTFGELKRVLAGKTALQPEAQRLLYQGKEREHDECLHMVGVTKLSKVVLLEDPASKQKKLEELIATQGSCSASGAVDEVKLQIDILVDKVAALKEVVALGEHVEHKEITGLNEQLMVLLLRLDGIKVDGDDRVQRKAQMRRIQSSVEILDHLMVISTHADHNHNARNMTTDKHMLKHECRVIPHWEVFD